jgi:FKBP-type peptidyl-prolyl cis-trans isomerase
MKSSKIVFGVLAMAITFAACQNVEFKKSSSGIPYKIFSSSKGDSVHAGSIVKYNVIQKTKDTVLFSSYANNSPFYAQIKPQAEKPTYVNIRATVEGLLLNTKEGDSLYLVQSADSLLKQNPEITLYKKGQQVITTIKVEKVYKNEEEANADALKGQAVLYEKSEKDLLDRFQKDTAVQASLQKDSKIIEDYLKAHNIKAEKDKWGFYVETLATGDGTKPKFGQFANVNYKGMHLSGEVFDQGVYPVQVGLAQVVKGFGQAVSQMSKGEKTRVYIPSILGYGPQGNPPKIQPNEVLIFELQTLDISDKQPEPQTLPQQQNNSSQPQK